MLETFMLKVQLFSMLNCIFQGHSRAYLGGAWCHGPPLGRQDSIIRME